MELQPPAPKKQPPLPDFSDINEQLTAVAARARVGEQRAMDLSRKLQVIEQNMLSNHKRALDEIKIIRSELIELKHANHVIEDRILTVVKELRLLASKETVDVLKKYLEIWNPVKFVTQDQVEKMIDEKLGKTL